MHSYVSYATTQRLIWALFLVLAGFSSPRSHWLLAIIGLKKNEVTSRLLQTKYPVFFPLSWMHAPCPSSSILTLFVSCAVIRHTGDRPCSPHSQHSWLLGAAQDGIGHCAALACSRKSTPPPTLTQLFPNGLLLSSLPDTVFLQETFLII